MAKRPITNDLYNTLLKSFRERPGEYAHASRVAQCDPRTAARAWKVGWVAQNGAWAPISKVLEEEQLAARARMQTGTADKAEAQRTLESIQLQGDREKAAADALAARGQEAQLVRLLRSDVTGGLAGVARLLPGMQKWAEWAANHMLDTNPKNLRDVTKMMEALSKVTERTAAAADRVMAMERRLLGKPEMIVGMALPEITLSEAAEHIDCAQETLEYARECGLLPPAGVEVDESDAVDAVWTEEPVGEEELGEEEPGVESEELESEEEQHPDVGLQ